MQNLLDNNKILGMSFIVHTEGGSLPYKALKGNKPSL